MSPPTIPLPPTQLLEARILVRHILNQESILRSTQARLTRAQNFHSEGSTWIWKNLKFDREPNRLAGLAELVQRNHSTYHVDIARMYRSFLRTMIAPLKPIGYPGEPAPPTPPPHTLDYSALTLGARPYLIGPYANLHANNRFAEVDLGKSRPRQGHIVMIHSGGPVDIELWQSRLPAINAWLTEGQAGISWTITAHTGTTVTLTRQTALPATIPYDRRYLTKGSLFVGIDSVHKTPVHIPFADLASGTYIGGSSGSGKTSAIHILLKSIFNSLDLFDAVWLVDGKDGVAFNRYAAIHPKVRVIHEDVELWQLAEDLTALMRSRNGEQRAKGIDKATSGFVAFVIDELPSFVSKPPKALRERHDAFIANLSKIAMRGRSAGIRAFYITQFPVDDQIPTGVRGNCEMSIAFRLPENAHATAVFGKLDAGNPKHLKTGQALVLQAGLGTVTPVQFPFAPLYQPRRSP